MKIGFDASRVRIVQSKTGVEHYAAQLLSWFARLDHETRFLVYTPGSDDPAFEGLPVNFLVRSIPFPRLWTHIRLNLALYFDRPDLVFIPVHSMPFFCPVPAVVVIHDVAFRHIPDSYSFFSRTYLDILTRYAVRNAHQIFVISDSTKRDLIHFYGCDPEKIAITHLGHDIVIEKKFLDTRKWDVIREKYAIHKDYLLSIGRIESKKNIPTLIDAFYDLLTQGHDLQLVLAGKPGYGYEQVVAKIRQYNIEDRVVMGYVSEEEKRYLLSYAKLFVFVPLYEGFGIPVLEAFAAGKKVVASDIPVFRELYADVVHFVDPRNPKQIAQGIIQALTDTIEAGDLSYRRKQIVEHFSWERCARETLSLIKKIGESLLTKKDP